MACAKFPWAVFIKIKALDCPHLRFEINPSIGFKQISSSNDDNVNIETNVVAGLKRPENAHASND